MNKPQSLALRKFRTLTGPARKNAVRAYLIAEYGVTFGLDPHTVPLSARGALADMAKVCGYRKPIACSLSLGTAFYRYLSRGVS